MSKLIRGRCLCLLILINLVARLTAGAQVEVAAKTNETPGLVIVKALFGDFANPYATVDVTATVAAMVKDDALDMTVTTDILGDPAVGIGKQLKVDYRINGVAGSRTINEGSRLVISARPNLDASSKLFIRKAVYGAMPDGGVKDVTALLATLVSGDRLEVTANSDDLGGDPALYVVKQLKVDYEINGVAGSRTVPEGYHLRLSAIPSKLVIRSAQYVALPNGKTNDVTAILASMIWDDQLDLKVSNEEFGDPAPLTIKQLRLDYEVDGVPVSKKYFEGSRLQISASDNPYPALPSTRLLIREARYGDLPNGVYNDVTEIVKAMVRNDSLEVMSSNDLFGEVLPVKKKLRVDFTFDGKEQSKTVEEGQVLKISASGEVSP